MLIKPSSVLQNINLLLTLLILGLALFALAKKINTERKAHGGSWKLTCRISAFDVVVGVIFILVAIGPLLPALFLHTVSVGSVLGLCVLIGATLALRRHALKRNCLPFDFKLELLEMAPALICLAVLWEMVEAHRNAGGH